MHLDSDNQLHDLSAGTQECPHCGRHTHLSVAAVPDFRLLLNSKPSLAGFVFQCDACHAPVFTSYRIEELNPERISFSHDPRETNRQYERFSLSYLPDPVAVNFRDALGCYSKGLLQGFAGMCRISAQTMYADLGESGKLRVFDEVEEIIQVAELDAEVAHTIRQVLFDEQAESLYFPGGLDRMSAAILLEIMKDVLYQIYIRHGRLRKALRMRRFFAEPSDDLDPESLHPNESNVATLPRNRPTGTN